MLKGEIGWSGNDLGKREALGDRDVGRWRDMREEGRGRCCGDGRKEEKGRERKRRETSTV